MKHIYIGQSGEIPGAGHVANGEEVTAARFPEKQWRRLKEAGLLTEVRPKPPKSTREET